MIYCAQDSLNEPAEENVLYNFITTEFITLDPQKVFDVTSSSIIKQTYEGLIEYDLETMQIKPLLCESWEFSDNGKRLIFHLRDNVYFHDDPCFPGGKGRKFAAKDVKFSFERNYWKKATGMQFLSSIKGFDIDNLPEEPGQLEGIRIIDELTVGFLFDEPNSTFLPALNRAFGYIVPEEAVKYYGEDFKYHTVGTGAFKLYRWEKNGDIILRKNPNYWGKDKNGSKLPHLDGIVFRLIKSPVLRLTRFSNKEIDILDITTRNFSVVFKDTSFVLNDFFMDMGCKAVSSPYSFSTCWLLFTPLSQFKNSTANIDNIRKIWKNPLLRKAISYAIDRQSIVDDIYGRWRTLPAKGEFPPGLNPYDENYKGYYYNPRKAEQLLNQAGFPEGRGLNEFKIVIREGISASKEGKYIQKNLSEIGIKSKIYQVPYGEKTDFVRNIGAELHWDAWTLDYPDAMNFFEPSAVDMPEEFAQKVFFEVNTEKRNLLLKEFERRMADLCNKVYLYHRRGPVRIVHQDIEGYLVSPMLHDNLKFVRKN